MLAGSRRLMPIITRLRLMEPTHAVAIISAIAIGIYFQAAAVRIC